MSMQQPLNAVWNGLAPVRHWLTTKEERETIFLWSGCAITNNEMKKAYLKACARSWSCVAVGMPTCFIPLTNGDLKTAAVGGALSAAFLYAAERRRRVVGQAVQLIRADEAREEAEGAESIERALRSKGFSSGRRLLRTKEALLKADVQWDTARLRVGHPTLLDRFLCVPPLQKLPPTMNWFPFI